MTYPVDDPRFIMLLEFVRWIEQQGLLAYDRSLRPLNKELVTFFLRERDETSD